MSFLGLAPHERLLLRWTLFIRQLRRTLYMPDPYQWHRASCSLIEGPGHFVPEFKYVSVEGYNVRLLWKSPDNWVMPDMRQDIYIGYADKLLFIRALLMSTPFSGDQQFFQTHDFNALNTYFKQQLDAVSKEFAKGID
jgi:hypothetical protein